MGGDAPVVVEVGAPSSSQSHTSPRSLLKVTSVAAASAGPSAKETVPSGAPSPVQVGATSAPSPSEPPTPPEPAVCSDAVGGVRSPLRLECRRGHRLEDLACDRVEDDDGVGRQLDPGRDHVVDHLP